jgi:peptidase inhibitor I78 family protein
MRRIALTAPALLAACSTAPAQPPVHGETSGHECQAAGLEGFAGQPGTSEIGAEILRVSKAATIRWVQPGQMVTMEFRADRVTVHLAAGNKIDRVNCG